MISAPRNAIRRSSVLGAVLLLCLPLQSFAQCETHATTDQGKALTGWPAGSTVTVYFESGQTGDLSAAQQQQYLAGMQYWTSVYNAGSIKFVASASQTNPNGAANTVYVTVSSTMAGNNPEETDPVINADMSTNSAVVSLNLDYLNGSLLSSASIPFQKQYLTYVAAHSTGHTLGIDDDYWDDGESVMNVILSDTISNGQDLGLGYISTTSLKTCDAQIEHSQYPNSAPPPSGGGGGGGTGGGPNPPVCVTGTDNCRNCIPPTCPPPTAWNPLYCTCYLYSTPIVIDTDGTGFHLTSAENGVVFDFFGNQKPVRIAWTAPGSTNGWLALDRNGNGTIDSGKELFGNFTQQPPASDPNGFLALAVFDEPINGGNGNGILDARDAVWPKLVIWIDTNHDGVSQPEELHHLDDIGIHSIGLMYRESRRVDQYGNEFRYQGWLNPDRGDHLGHIIYDVILQIDGSADLFGTSKSPSSLQSRKRPSQCASPLASSPD